MASACTCHPQARQHETRQNSAICLARDREDEIGLTRTIRKHYFALLSSIAFDVTRGFLGIMLGIDCIPAAELDKPSLGRLAIRHEMWLTGA